MKKEIIKKLKKCVIDSEGVRPMWFYLDCFVSSAWAKMKKESGLDVGMITVSQDNLSKFYVFFKKEAIFQEFVNKILEDKDFLNRLRNKILQSKNKVTVELDKANYANLSNEALVKATGKYLRLTADIYKMAVYLRCIDRGLRIILSQHPNCKKIEESIPTLVGPSYSLKERKMLEKLASTIKAKSLSLDSRFAEKELNKIKNKFCWITYGNYKEKAKSLEDYKKEIEDIFNHPRNSFKKLKKVSLSRVDASIARLAAKAAYLKDEFKFLLNEVIFKSEKLFKEISARTGKPIEVIKNMRPEDMTFTLEGKLKSAVGKKYALIGYKNKVEYIENPGKLIHDFIKSGFERAYELQGRIASRGYGRGFVKVILGQGDFGKFEKGDILVVNNTTPNYVSIMKDAAAIVAEEGGLTAHVSVVSREFKVPCIVGVGNATSMLKDGDMVEVDAERGVVRIIKRA